MVKITIAIIIITIYRSMILRHIFIIRPNIFPSMSGAEMNWYTYQRVIFLPLWQTSSVCGDVNPIICPPPPSATNIDAIIDCSEVNLCDRLNIFYTCETLNPYYPSTEVTLLTKYWCAAHIQLYKYTSSPYCNMLLGAFIHAQMIHLINHGYEWWSVMYSVV